MIKIPSWCRECPFYYPGMTAEDYLYLQHRIKSNNDPEIVMRIQRREIELSAIENRTKEEVFEKFSGDVNYIFDMDTMT